MHPAERSRRRRLAQNDLVDPGSIDRIVRAVDAASPIRGSRIVEIGCGTGALTLPLLHRGPERLVALDSDPARLEALASSVPADAPVDIVALDATDAAALRGVLERKGAWSSTRIVGSLPYNVGTAIVDVLLGFPGSFTDAHLVLQLEVVERMRARARSDAYGFLSVTTRLRADVTLVHRIASDAFHPRPRVVSALVRLVPRPEPLGPAWRPFLAYLSAAFGQRRKTLAHAISRLVPPERTRAAIDRVGRGSACRAEELEPEEHVALFRELGTDFGAPRGVS